MIYITYTTSKLELSHVLEGRTSSRWQLPPTQYDDISINLYFPSRDLLLLIVPVVARAMC